MLGRGLESLIPKKGEGNKEPVHNPSIAGDSPTPAVGDHLRSQPSDSPQLAGRPSSAGFRESLSGLRTGSQHRKELSSESVFQIEVEKIKSNPFQPRKDFNDEELQGLAQSIREYGILQPLIVSKLVRENDLGTEVEYQLIAGERRLMAAKLIGMRTVPAIVKKVDEHRLKFEMALIENIQRADLNPIEAAKAYARLQDEFGLTQREIASRVGKSREAIANTVRLLNLPLHMQEAVIQGKLNESHARTLLAIQNIQEQERIFATLLAQKMSVRALREETKKPVVFDPQAEYWRKQLEEKLGAPVRVVKKGPRGKMVIQFYSEDEWHAILNRLLGEESLG